MTARVSEDVRPSTSGLAAGYPAVCLLCFLRLGRELGVDASSTLGELTEDALASRTLTVPWSVTLHFFDELLSRLTEPEKHELARRYLKSLPFLTAIMPLVPSVNAFLALLWRGAAGVTMPFRSSYTMTATHHELAMSMEEIGPGLGYTEITGIIAKHSPSALGAPSLEVLDWECTPWKLRVRLSPPLDWVSNERRQNASEMPFSLILQSLQLLGPVAEAATRDELLVFPGRQTAVLEVAQLGNDWNVTPTEARVALVLSEGKSLAEIASELDITVATVRVHLKHLYAKTETANQRELVARVAAWRKQ